MFNEIKHLFNSSSEHIAKSAAEKISIERLPGLLDGGLFSGRQELCNFLGTRESTLSGWIKENRLPHYAKVAIGLLSILKDLQEEYQEYAAPIPLKMEEGWGLVQIDHSNKGAPKASLIAEGISDLKEAKRLAQGYNTSKKLFLSYLDDLEGLGFDNPLEDSPYQTRRLLLKTCRLLKDDEEVAQWFQDRDISLPVTEEE